MHSQEFIVIFCEASKCIIIQKHLNATLDMHQLPLKNIYVLQVYTHIF